METENKDAVVFQGDLNGTVVVINSSRFGQGNPRLGESLMNSFFYALYEGEILPQTILFYNAGCILTCKDSLVLPDLKSLEAKGVHIFTDGTSLEFYGLKDSLAVGHMINMVEMTQIMMQASKIVKP